MDNLPDLNKASKRLERAREGARPGGRPPPPLQTNQELERSTAAAAAAAASARPVGGDVRLQSSPSARSRSRRPAGGSSGGKTPTLSSSRKTCFISYCATEERRGGRGVRRALRHPFPPPAPIHKRTEHARGAPRGLSPPRTPKTPQPARRKRNARRPRRANAPAAASRDRPPRRGCSFPFAFASAPSPACVSVSVSIVRRLLLLFLLLLRRCRHRARLEPRLLARLLAADDLRRRRGPYDSTESRNSYKGGD